MKSDNETNVTEADFLLTEDKNCGQPNNKSYGTLFSDDSEDRTAELCFNLESEKEQETTRPFKDLYYFATTWDCLLIVIGCLAAVISGVGMPLSSIVFGQLSNSFINSQINIDKVGKSANLSIDSNNDAEEFRRLANLSCIYYAILGVIIFASGYVQLVCWQLVCERQVNALRRHYFNAVLRQDIAWFDRNSSGALTVKLTDNLERIKEAIGDKFGILLQSLVQFVAGFVVAFIYSWQLALVMVAVSPLVGLCGWMMAKFVSNVSRKEQENYANAGAIAEEVLSCMRTVIAFNGQKQEIQRYENQLVQGRRLGVRKAQLSGALGGLSSFIIFSIYGLAFYIGGKLIVAGQLDPGTVFTVFYATMGGAHVVGRAGPQFALIQAARGAATSILNIIDRKPTIDSSLVEGKRLHTVKGNIKLENVHFSYDTRKDVKVLDGIDLDIVAGETVALVGHSGCGKSTIISLLLRFYNNKFGKISLDGEDITDLNINWLRNTIGVVSQEPVLFDMSIEENIRLGRCDVTEAELVSICKMANCHDFIQLLPQGYQTLVGERGAQISGGQKQRIAIARALVRNPKILLLDEATSALDTESERLVQTALDKASKGRTTISIAHRLSTIRNCKKIVAMEKGKIQEVGTHDELMKKEGLYYNLVFAQQLNDSGSVKKSEEDNSTKVTSKVPRQESVATVADSQISLLTNESEVRRRISVKIKKTPAETERERMKAELKLEGTKQATLKQILGKCEGQWVFLIGGLFCAIIQGIVYPVFSLIYSQMFAAFTKEGQALLDDARFYGLMFALLGAIDALEYFFGVLCFGYLGENVTLRMRTKVFTNVMRQDVSYFDDPKRSVGKICTRLATDAPNVKQAISWRIAGVFSAVVSMSTGMIIGFVYGWQLTLLVLIVCPLVALAMAMRMKLRTKSAGHDSELLELSGKVAVEAIENIRTVQSLTREPEFYETFCSHLEQPFKRAKKEAHIQAVYYGFATAVYFWMYSISFSFAAFLVEQNIMEPVAVFKVFFAINFSSLMLAQATSFFPEYFKATFAGGLIFKMLAEKPLIDSFGQEGLKPNLSGSLEFSNVDFSYPTRPDVQVITSLSFKVEHGKTLALVGPSGCGKSTAVGLIERFYDPVMGSIIFDQHDARHLNVAYMRHQIGLVSQEPILFDISIADNIGYGLQNITLDKIHEAARKANIHQFIAELPMGFNTRVGEKGIQLSGGQKQRIAIARALVRDPKVLLLDEATSALDSQSEKVVQEALDRAREGRTSIIIAHRLSTVQTADCIAVIRDGRIIEQGTHDELVLLKGAYYDLTTEQNLE